MSDYPSRFPCPSWEYALAHDMGLARAEYDSGHTRQRRRHKSLHTGLTLSFAMTTGLYKDWLDWMFQSGTAWFEIDLETHETGNAMVKESIRLVGPVSVQYQDWGNVSVSVSAELKDD